MVSLSLPSSAMQSLHGRCLPGGIVSSSRQKLGQKPTLAFLLSADLSALVFSSAMFSKEYCGGAFFQPGLQIPRRGWYFFSHQQHCAYYALHLTSCITSKRSKCASVSSLISSTVAAALMIQQGRQKDIGLCKYININETLVCVFCPSCIMFTEIFKL